jgi:hypothetical protein
MTVSIAYCAHSLPLSPPPPMPIAPATIPSITIGTPPARGKSPIHSGARLLPVFTHSSSSRVGRCQCAAVFALRIAVSELVPGRCPFLALSVQQRVANGSKRRHKAKVRNSLILLAATHDRQRPTRSSKERLTSFFPSVNRRVAGSNPACGANLFNNLRTTDLSSGLHVALFRAHFIRGFPRRVKAPGCSRIRNH